MRTLAGIILMSAMAGAIGFIFWSQEMKYWAPTPIPTDLVQVAMGDHVDVSQWVKYEDGKPVFLHFYNFDCPCSRFNITEFQSMYYRYRDSVNFVAVVQSSEPDQNLEKKFQRLIGVPIKTIVDRDGVVAKAMGIYSTPQAVILKDRREVFYKGNYNSARYCTTKSTKFAEMALQDILDGKLSPRFAESLLELPYGCLIPAYEAPQVSLNVSWP